MPYIDPKLRPQLDALMDPLIDDIRTKPTEEQDGLVDYVLTRMLVSLYQPPFFNLNRALGVLASTTQEYYRIVVAPYEDEKIEEYGAVKPSAQPGKSKVA